MSRNAPTHRIAINALNAQGRKKSQFVANAIAEYIMKGSGQAQVVQPDREYIREICREVVREYMEKQEKDIQTQGSVTPEHQKKVISRNDEPYEFDFEKINETLSGFRKK